MGFGNINQKDAIFSLDIGTRSVIGTVGVVKEKKFHVISEYYLEHDERAMIDGQIHDINLVAKAVANIKKALEKDLGFELGRVAIAAAGRFLRTTSVKAEIEVDSDREIDKDIVRSLELTAVKKAEEEVNYQFDGRLYCVGYSVKSYYLNGYVITNLLAHKGENIGVEVIATFLPRSVVDSLYAVMDKVRLEVISLTLEPIAAIEAAIPQNLRLLNLALVDIGAGTSDIAISSKDSIVAYGMVPMAGDEVTEAIAHAYLVDFNTAERMKRECSMKEMISYTDVLGLDNEVSSEEIIKVIYPVIEKISIEVSGKIVELNGGKSPNAVFLVGGGAHTPKIRELLAEKLGLQLQRIGIKGRDAVTDCVCLDNNLGSTGVTVLGIAMVSIKRLGQDFINVLLNGNVVSLFNSHKHTVMDVLLQAGISPKVLIGKNGKNIRFTLNGSKRLAFGTLAINAKILINGIEASVDSDVKEGDNIEVKYAQDGREAAPRVMEYVTRIYSISFYFNEKLYTLEPLCSINGRNCSVEQVIRENDNVDIVYPAMVGDFQRYYLENFDKDQKFYLKDNEIEDDYTIKEGDKIYSRQSYHGKVGDSGADSVDKKGPALKAASLEAEKEGKKEITVAANDNYVKMTGKDKYVFIDIFDFIDFDLTRTRGNLVLLLNGQKAGYYDELKEKDIIMVYWE